MATVTMRVAATGRDFQRAAAYARSVGGRYDGATQTWRIPDQWEANARMRGLRTVEAAQPTRCPHYTVDQGCPLHGETCR